MNKVAVIHCFAHTGGDSNACIVCWASGCRMFTCSWCKRPAYCSRKCQKRHWASGHREYHYGREPHLHVSVTTLSGQEMTVDIPKRARIADLQHIIARDMSIPVRRQQLTCGEIVLSDPKLRIHFVREAAGILLGAIMPITVVVRACEESDSDSLPPLVDSD